MAGDIIGRREELRSLRTFLTALPAGGQALLLEGDPGIGKTTLWHDGVRAARDDDYRVLTARQAQSETRIVFATLGDLLGPALEVVLPQLQPLQRRALETALLLRESEGPPPEARALALAVQSVVVTLAQERPLLLAQFPCQCRRLG
jgi:predicted ATPase